jgi:hypothetical protein
VYGDFKIRITEHPDNPEVVLGRPGLLLEALEDTADIDRLQGGLLREGFLNIDGTLNVVIAGLLLLDVAQSHHLTGYEARQKAMLFDDVAEWH